MSSNEKLQAVTYWNNFAEQLHQTVVNDNIVVSEQNNLNGQVAESSSFYTEQTEYYTSEPANLMVDSGATLTPLTTLTEQQSSSVTIAPPPEATSGSYSQTTSTGESMYTESSLVAHSQNFEVNSLELDNIGDEFKATLMPSQNYEPTQANLSANPPSHSMASVISSQYTYQLSETNVPEQAHGNTTKTTVHSSLIPQSYPIQDCMEYPDNSKVDYQVQSSLIYGNHNHIEPNLALNCPIVPMSDTSVDTERNCYNSIQKQQFQNPGYIHYSADYQMAQTNTHPDSPDMTLDRSQTFTYSDKPLQQIQCSYASLGESTGQPCDPSTTFKPRPDLQSVSVDPSLVIDNRKSTNPNNSSLHFQTVPMRDVESTLGLTETNANSTCHMCEVCGKSGFSTKGNLKRHLRAHSGVKPFKCEYCNACFTEKKSLKIHVRRHTGEKPYKCDICDKYFSQTGVLQSHIALHYNRREFKCHRCDKAFRQRSQLNVHLMRHEGVKRLQCSSCDAKFLTKGDLERHRRTHTGERPYACELCNKTFTRQQSLREHMNRHTGKKAM